jgi:mevalonate kinase
MVCSVGLCLQEFGDFEGGLDVKVKSQLPIISGFGSSAYVATSIIGGISELMSEIYGKQELFKRVYEIEEIMHGKPSGGDPTVVINGGFIRFQKKGEKFDFQALEIKKEELPEIFIINSGKASETTGEMVNMVGRRLNSNKRRFSKIIKRMGKISSEFIEKIEKGIFSVELLKENERYLEELGVVGRKAKKMIELIESEGGVAKISGGGGIKEGSGVLISYHDDREKLSALINKKQWQFFPTKLGGEGWKID